MSFAKKLAVALIPMSGSNDKKARNLGRCVGECDSDSQCAAGLKCHKKDKHTPIAGCSGQGAGAGWDYCYDPATKCEADGTCHITEKCGGVSKGEAGRYSVKNWIGSRKVKQYFDNDIITKYQGFGLMHKIAVAKWARLQLQVVRRTSTFNYALTIRTTPKAVTSCKLSDFYACAINADTSFKNLGKTTSSYVYYPEVGKGAAADMTVYVGIQTETAVVKAGESGYFLKYSVCRKVKGKWGGVDGALCPANGDFSGTPPPPPPKALVNNGGSAHKKGKVKQCEGDCDKDSHCADGLRCFQRSGYTAVPGCSGQGKKNYDYCVY